MSKFKVMKENVPFLAKSESEIGKTRFAAVRADWQMWMKADLACGPTSSGHRTVQG